MRSPVGPQSASTSQSSPCPRISLRPRSGVSRRLFVADQRAGPVKAASVVEGHLLAHPEPRIGSGEALLTCRDREARGHPLRVVPERPGKCLSKSFSPTFVRVTRTHQSSRGGRCRTVDDQAGRRCVLEICRHDLSPAPAKGERRHQHPPMANRYEIGHSSGVPLVELRDWINTVPSPAPIRRAPRHFVPPSPPLATRSSMLGCTTPLGRTRLAGCVQNSKPQSTVLGQAGNPTNRGDARKEHVSRGLRRHEG